MTSTRSLARLSLVFAFVCASLLNAQQPVPVPQQPGSPPLDLAAAPPQHNSIAFRETDLLRRDGFSSAAKASILLHLADRKGQPAPPLQPGAFKVLVNGTERTVTLLSPGESVTRAVPTVLLVFPPNQPVLHSIGIHQAQTYFSSLPGEKLPWKVAIFDSDGTQTPFSDSRSQLLASLNVSDHTAQPFQYTTELGLPYSLHWSGPWLSRAESAVAAMQPVEGPKVIIAYNPIRENIYGDASTFLADNGPESLVPTALNIGAHIYIANSGGPEVVNPVGDASQHGNGVGPASYSAAASQSISAFLGTAYHTSLIRQTADQTFGGYANSLKDLAAQIHRNLDDNYTLTFDLTARDRDKAFLR